MPKRPNLIPSLPLNTVIPLPLYTQLAAQLYSDLEQRVPHGAYSRFIAERLREYFATEALDLAEYLRVPQDTHLVRGSSAAIAALRELIKQGLAQ